MRIAYYAHLNDRRGSGVVAKISTQLEYWRREGHSTKVFLTTRLDDQEWPSSFGDADIAPYDGPVSRMRSVARLVDGIRRFRPDIVYLRWDLFYPPMVRLPTDAPLVVEVNSDDVAESALGGRARRRYNAMTRGLLLRRATAAVFVTGELGRSSAFEGFKGERVVISNGVDLAAYPSLPVVETGPPRVAFVGTAGQPWHGFDKLVTLAHLRPDWQVDVVGASEPLQSAPNIRWHGTLDRHEVLRVLAGSDVGIGTLALHRKSMEEACPLKVREYLAVGLPIVYGYSDPDADGLSPFVLRIANTESNVEDAIEAIDAFVRAARGVRVPRDRVAHIDVAYKEKQRLALFDQLAGR